MIVWALWAVWQSSLKGGDACDRSKSNTPTHVDVWIVSLSFAHILKQKVDRPSAKEMRSTLRLIVPLFLANRL